HAHLHARSSRFLQGEHRTARPPIRYRCHATGCPERRAGPRLARFRRTGPVTPRPPVPPGRSARLPARAVRKRSRRMRRPHPPACPLHLPGSSASCPSREHPACYLLTYHHACARCCQEPGVARRDTTVRMVATDVATECCELCSSLRRCQDPGGWVPSAV